MLSGAPSQGIPVFWFSFFSPPLPYVDDRPAEKGSLWAPPLSKGLDSWLFCGALDQWTPYLGKTPTYLT